MSPLHGPISDLEFFISASLQGISIFPFFFLPFLSFPSCVILTYILFYITVATIGLTIMSYYWALWTASPLSPTFSLLLWTNPHSYCCSIVFSKNSWYHIMSYSKASSVFSCLLRNIQTDPKPPLLFSPPHFSSLMWFSHLSKLLIFHVQVKWHGLFHIFFSEWYKCATIDLQEWRLD